MIAAAEAADRRLLVNNEYNVHPRTLAALAAGADALIARLENVPFSRWHLRPRVVVGTATFFDAFDALSAHFVYWVSRLKQNVAFDDFTQALRDF